MPPKPINDRTVKQAMFDIIIELREREPESQITKYITSHGPIKVDFMWYSITMATYEYTIETVEIEGDEHE